MNLYSTKDFATLTGVSIRTLKRWRKSGKLVPQTIKGDKFYSEEQLAGVTKYLRVTNFDVKVTNSTSSKVTNSKVVTPEGDKIEGDKIEGDKKVVTLNQFVTHQGDKSDKFKVTNSAENNFVTPNLSPYKNNFVTLDENLSPSDTEFVTSSENMSNENCNVFSQHLENLPTELLSQPRFFALLANDKSKPPTGWNLPENQKLASALHGVLGFDTSGHDIRTSYLFLDFDHVLRDGKFVADSVFQLVQLLQVKFPNIFIEISSSGTGLHTFLIPSAGLFKSCAAGSNATLFFTNDRSKNAPKLEIFYNTGARYCLVTGNKFSTGSLIPSGSDVDAFFYDLLDKIKSQQPNHQQQQDRKHYSKNYSDSPSEQVRALAMLDFLPCSDLTYSDWVAVGMILKNNGNSLADWEHWSATDSARYKVGECEKKWNGFKDFGGLSIASLYKLAVFYGYDEKGFRRKWYRDNSDFNSHSQKSYSDDDLDALYKQLDDIKAQLADFELKKIDSIESLKAVEKFDKDTVFADDILTAAAFAFLYNKKAFSDFKAAIQNQVKLQKTEKFIVEWQGDVRSKAKEIQADYFDLLAKKNEIIAKIKNAEFTRDNDSLKGFVIPDGYSLSAESGIEKIVGKDIFLICRRVIVIKGIAYSVEDKTYKLILRFLTNKWHFLQPIGEGTIFNTRKIVDLADFHLPVTSVNAKGVVEFLDAFKCLNEDIFPLSYIVSRCGWHSFNNTKIFVDPRRKNSIDVNGKKVTVEVDSSSTFAQSLKQKGSVEEWKKAYDLAKNSPVARLIVAAAVAPPLLKILGERNFVLYIHGATRGGKSTSAFLAASAVGNNDLVISFDGTNNGLLGKAAETTDFPFFVDEKQSADSKLKSDFQRFIYSVANGTERSRANKDGSFKPIRKWQNITICNGETELLDDSATGGAHTRLLQIHAPKTILDADTCKKIKDIIEKNFGVIFPKVIDKFLAYGADNLRQDFEKTVGAFTKNFNNILPEYCRYMAILTLADTFLNLVLGTDDIEAAMHDAVTSANNIFQIIPTLEEISDAPREKNFVLGFIAQNQKSFLGATPAEIENITAIFGKFDDDLVYVTVAALKTACEKSGFDYKKLVNDLVEDKFFIPDDKVTKGRKNPYPFVLKKINGVNTRCYRISRENIGGDF